MQQLFYTKQPVFVSTSSAWGVMEGAIRNLVSKKVLSCMSGAFSDKWFDVAKKCGKQAEALQVEWGQPILPEAIEAKLATGEFDAVTLIHNETSTGTMNPLWDIAAVMRKFPDVQFIVDCVSSFTAMKIPFDELGIDVMLAGTQKALALPAGAAVFAVSEKAYAKAATIKDRGYYFDFLEFKKNQESSMTPTTPSISHFYALQSKIEDILAEGQDARYARHLENAKITRAWATKHGFQPLPEGRLRVDLADLRREQQEHRRREADQHAQDEAFVHHRRRLRQDQGDELPHFDHGRREHGKYPAAARLAGRVPEGDLVW